MPTKRTMPSVPEIRAALADQTEAEVSHACRQWLTAHGYLWYRMNSGAVKTDTRFIRYGTPGMADVLVILAPSGRCVWCEMKRPLGPKGGERGSARSPEQVRFAEDAARVGAAYHIIRSMDDIARAIAEETETAKIGYANGPAGT